VVYGGERRSGGSQPRVRLEAVGADGSVHEVHGWLDKPDPRGSLAVDVPAGATEGGSVTLRVYHETAGGAGRGAQVSEVWLQRTDRELIETPPPERRRQEG
jgi:hypothetical protein